MSASSQTQIVRVRCGDRTATVALCTGLGPAEMAELLGGALGVFPGKILGLTVLHSDQIVPLSLACRFIHALCDNCYDLLTTEGVVRPPSDGLADSRMHVHGKSTTDLHQVGRRPKLNELDFESAEEVEEEFEFGEESTGFDSQYDEDGEELVEKATKEAVEKGDGEFAGRVDRMEGGIRERFIGKLGEMGHLSEKETMELLAAVQSEDQLIGAAFEVADASHDAMYLAALLKSIAQHMLDPDTRATVIVAQTELIKCAHSVCHGPGPLKPESFVEMANAVLSYPAAAVSAYRDLRTNNNMIQALTHLLNAVNKIIEAGEDGSGPDEDQVTVPAVTEDEEETEYEEDFEDFESGSEAAGVGGAPSPHSSPPRSTGRRLHRFEDITQLVPELNASGALVGTEGLLLRQLVDENHQIVRAAWEVYEIDPSIDELKDTLVHAVKLEKVRRGYTMGPTSTQPPAATQPARSSPPRPEAKPTPPAALKDFDRYLDIGQSNSILTAGQRKFLLERFMAGDELVVAAWQLLELESDQHDFFDTLLRIYRHHNLPSLLVRPGADGAAADEPLPTPPPASAAPAKPPRPPAQTRAKLQDEGDGSEALVGIVEQCVELMIKRESMLQPTDKPVPMLKVAEALREMAAAKDPRVIMVLSEFSDSRDVERLIGDLELIGQAKVMGLIQSPTDESKDEVPPAPSAAPVAAAEEEADDEARRFDLGPHQESFDSSSGAAATARQDRLLANGITEADQKKIIIEAMAHESIISSEEMDRLVALMATDDPKLNAAFEAFFESNDLAQLSARLCMLAQRESESTQPEIEMTELASGFDGRARRASKVAAEDDAGIELATFEGERGPSEGGDADESERRAALHAQTQDRLAAILDCLDLDAKVQATLMGGGPVEQHHIMAALEVFSQTKDVADLKDTLERVAVKLMSKHDQEEADASLVTLEERVSAAEAIDEAHEETLDELDAEVKRLQREAQ